MNIDKKSMPLVRVNLVIDSNNGDGRASQSVIQFHKTHGKNVRLSANRSTARRIDSFCEGVVFSHRTVRPNKKVYLRVTDVSTSWSGNLGIGFTSFSPASFKEVLPRSFFPGLTSRPGFWGKELPEYYVDIGVLLAFHYTTNGDVMLNVNGQDEGVFFKGVDARTPLWFSVDIFSNTTAVQFVDPIGRLKRHSLLNSPTKSSTSLKFYTPPRREADLLVSIDALNLDSGPNQIPSSPISPVPDKQLTWKPSIPGSSAASTTLQYFPTAPPLHHFSQNVFQPLTFHPRTHGVNIRIIGSDDQTAVRRDDKYCNGCVFSSRPINLGESWVVQIVQTNSEYVGFMEFGFTSCNPASLSSTNLPDDVDDLFERPEYWVILRNSIFEDELISGDEIEFHLFHDGKVTIKKRNGDEKTNFMHVDVSLPLWAIFDVYGSTQAIRLLSTSTICPPQPAESSASVHEASAQTSLLRPQPIQHQPINQVTRSVTPKALQQPVLSSGAFSYVETDSLNQSAGGTGSKRKCTVCYGRSVDCVVIPCGHISFCYDCALKLHYDGRTSGGQGLCPICRVPIREVIRVYES